MPDLGIQRLTAKIDTGARTSALHVSHVAPIGDPSGADGVRFRINLGEHTGHQTVVSFETSSAERRMIKSSNAKSELRYVIRTKLQLGPHLIDADFALSDRKDMRHAVLIGRTALRSRLLINPGRTFLLGRDASATETQPRKRKEFDG